MDKQERMNIHATSMGSNYQVYPQRHIHNSRDWMHVTYSRCRMYEAGCKSLLDIGSYDGWHAFLLHEYGFQVDGVELIPCLAEASRRYAAQNSIPWTCYEGFFDDVQITCSWDAVSAYEVLEHIPIEEVPLYVKKMESVCKKLIMISLPDQDHHVNPQHCWSPTEENIKELFKDKNPAITYEKYTGIPANWFISYRV